MSRDVSEGAVWVGLRGDPARTYRWPPSHYLRLDIGRGIFFDWSHPVQLMVPGTLIHVPEDLPLFIANLMPRTSPRLLLSPNQIPSFSDS